MHVQWSCAFVMALALGAGLAAQPDADYKTGTEFYMAYRAAITKATTAAEILPWLTKSRRDLVTGTPAPLQAEMFGILKAIDEHARITVLKETPTANGADLLAEATIDATKSKGTGVITLVKERGVWKLERETWKGGM
jgi:hypothetical protein